MRAGPFSPAAAVSAPVSVLSASVMAFVLVNLRGCDASGGEERFDRALQGFVEVRQKADASEPKGCVGENRVGRSRSRSWRVQVLRADRFDPRGVESCRGEDRPGETE